MGFKLTKIGHVINIPKDMDLLKLEIGIDVLPLKVQLKLIHFVLGSPNGGGHSQQVHESRG